MVHGKCLSCSEDRETNDHGLCDDCYESEKQCCIEHMAEDIEKGCTEGRSDSEYFSMSWKLETEIF
jgi:hypothetical protein